MRSLLLSAPRWTMAAPLQPFPGHFRLPQAARRSFALAFSTRSEPTSASRPLALVQHSAPTVILSTMMRLSPLPTLRSPSRTLRAQRHLPRRLQSTAPPPLPHAYRIPIGRHVAFGVGLGAAGELNKPSRASEEAHPHKTGTLAAALLTNSDTADRRAQVSGGWWPRQREWKGLDPELASLRLREVVQRVRKAVGAFGDDWRLPTILGQNYLNLTEEKRTQLAIIGLTAGVFVVWNIPACRAFSARFLWHDPLAARPVTLVTSIFAHKVSPLTVHETSTFADLSTLRSPSLTLPSTPSLSGPSAQHALPTLITMTTFYLAPLRGTSSLLSSSPVS